MKNFKFLTLLVILIMPTVGNGQLIGVGTKWTYDKNVFIPIGPLERSVQTITAVADTIIDGEEFLIIEGGCDCSNLVRYIRIEDRRYYMHYNGAKHLVYDFNLNEGDILAIKSPFGNGSQDSVKVRIMSVSEIEHQGQTLKVQELDYDFPDDSNFWADWGPTFVEGVGSTGYCFFPQHGLCEAGTGPLRCIDFADGNSIKFTDEPFCDQFTSVAPWTTSSLWTYRKWGLSPANTVNFRLIGNEGPTGKLLVRMNESGDIVAGSAIPIWTEEDKVYYIDSLDQKRLMYDFSPTISVGDTIEYWLPPNANMYDISSNGGMQEIQNPYSYVVEDISLVSDEDGNPLRKYSVNPYINLDLTVDDPPCNIITEVIQNVGSTTGFIRMGCEQLTAGFGPEFRCFSSSAFTYKEVQGECVIVSTEEFIDEDVKIYPNPFSELLHIETKANLSKVEIYDSVGNMIVRDTASVKINVENLPTGVYILRLTDQQGRTSSQMLAKI